MTFLCGRGGLYALGAVVANYMGDLQKRDLFLGLFMEVMSIILPKYPLSMLMLHYSGAQFGCLDISFKDSNLSETYGLKYNTQNL